MLEGHDFSVTACIYDCLFVLIHGLQIFRILYKILASMLTTHSLLDGPRCQCSLSEKMVLSLDYLLLGYL